MYLKGLRRERLREKYFFPVFFSSKSFFVDE
jgi:hypothetical protein